MSSPSLKGTEPRKPPDRATLRRAVKGLERVLEKQPEDLRSMVRMARAYRLLGDKVSSEYWYRRSIDGFSLISQGLRALALAKELLSVAPHDHSLLIEMARLYARHPQGERRHGRVATPIPGPESSLDSFVKESRSIPREFTATSAKALELLDDAAEVERMEPGYAAGEHGEESAVYKQLEMNQLISGEVQAERADVPTQTTGAGSPQSYGDHVERSDNPSPAQAQPKAVVPPPPGGVSPDIGDPPPPPPPEAFLVTDEPGGEQTSNLASDPAWSSVDDTSSPPLDPARPPDPAPSRSLAGRLKRLVSRDVVPSTDEVLVRAKMGDLPLLSSLGENAFVTLYEAMKPLALREGEVLFREAEDARSFFIVAQGRLEAWVKTPAGRDKALATLGEGEVVGLFGLYSGRKRGATVVAIEPAVVFEVTDQVLARLVREHPASKKPLSSFYRARLLEISLGASPLFQELPREKRLAIVERFEHRRHQARDAVIAPGQVTLGLYLVMRGQVVVSLRDSGRVSIKAKLSRGQFFGCISALTGMPTLASAECTEETVLAVLPHKTFSELLDLEPALSALPRRLREEGVLVTPTVFVGDKETMYADSQA